MIRHDLKEEFEQLCLFYGLDPKDELNLLIYKFIQDLKHGATKRLPSGVNLLAGNKASH